MALSQKTKSITIVIVLFALILMPFIYTILKEVVFKPAQPALQAPPALDAAQKN